MEAQITIHNVKTGDSGPKRAVLSIKASLLNQYIENLRTEANSVFDKNASSRFESFPLLKLVDSFDTGEEFIYKTVEDLPSESVFNSKNDPVLYILPNDCSVHMGLNLIAPAKKVTPHAVKEEAQNERS
jgi:hypothetical protein